MAVPFNEMKSITSAPRRLRTHRMFEAANCLRERFIAEECDADFSCRHYRLQQQGPVHPEQDPIIGPGKAIDTNTFFVLSCDTLVNLNARAPQVITTGPTSIDPDTGARYGMG